VIPDGDPEEDVSIVLQDGNAQPPHLVVRQRAVRQFHVDVPRRVGHDDGKLAEHGHVELAQVALDPLKTTTSAHLYASRVASDRWHTVHTHTHTHTQPSYGPFSRTTRVSRCQKNLLLDFMVQRKITEADTLTIQLGATPSRLISDPPLSSPIFTPDALPAATLPLYPGLGEASNMLACIPSGTVSWRTAATIKCRLKYHFVSELGTHWHNLSLFTRRLPQL